MRPRPRPDEPGDTGHHVDITPGDIPAGVERDVDQRGSLDEGGRPVGEEERAEPVSEPFRLDQPDRADVRVAGVRQLVSELVHTHAHIFSEN